MKHKGIYKGTFENFQRYWKFYGGWRELLASFYLLASVLLTAVLFPVWTQKDWWDVVIGVMPNLLGFSLGGYAMLFAFGNEAFLKLLALVQAEQKQATSTDQPEEKVSAFITISATFIHFIVIQFLSLVIALLAKSTFSLARPSVFPSELNLAIVYIFWFTGFFLFIYALLCGAAAAFAIFRMTTWFDIYQQAEEEKRKKKEQEDKEQENQQQ